MKNIIAITILLLAGLSAAGQTKDLKRNQFADFSASIGKSAGTVALSYVHNWRTGKKKKFELGIGGRFTSYIGQNRYYRTAPAIITSGKTGPLVFFEQDIVANIDTVLINHPQVNLLNLTFNFGYHFNAKWYAGFNIDVIGFSFGADKAGRFINGSSGQLTKASIANFNALLTSDNDYGSLNSELFGKYQFNKKWGVKAGLQFLFTEYKTNTKVQTYPRLNDRFRNKVPAFVGGVSYNF
ncbi:MAG: hypothetical protein EKK37_00060 [Sphingobacteriales bacterium]|nr:MAG: hypothetical protein EKK37_00060 [Sphingobacteriales bacterium]